MYFGSVLEVFGLFYLALFNKIFFFFFFFENKIVGVVIGNKDLTFDKLLFPNWLLLDYQSNKLLIFARFVRPRLATILCVWQIWSGSNNRIYMYHVFHWLAKKKTRYCTGLEADL